MISQTISSFYAYTWDIKMDWGLMDKNAGENTLLREETVYSSKTYYYFAIVEDFILRFGWTISVALAKIKIFDPQHTEWLPSLLAMLEVFRRFVWNFFRLENEHLNNCGNFTILNFLHFLFHFFNSQNLPFFQFLSILIFFFFSIQYSNSF